MTIHLRQPFLAGLLFLAFHLNAAGVEKGWIPAYEKMKSLGIKSVDFRVAEGMGHGFFNSQPWADVTLTSADNFLKELGFIEGEPTLAVPRRGEKLVKRP